LVLFNYVKLNIEFYYFSQFQLIKKTILKTFKIREKSEDLMKSRISYEKLTKQLEGQLQEQSSKIEDLLRQTSDSDQQFSRLQAENSQVASQLEASVATVASLGKLKLQLESQVEALKQSLEDEARAKATQAQLVKNLNADVMSLKG